MIKHLSCLKCRFLSVHECGFPCCQCFFKNRWQSAEEMEEGDCDEKIT